jgi:UDP-3-O-[3-hydroxymyristoyl] glucosamine N-acyltransferase
MTTPFIKYLAACAFALAAAGICNVASAADDTHPKAEAVLKGKAKAKKAKAKKAVKEEAEVASTEPEPDITASVTIDYNCELGNKVTIYTNMTDSEHMALRWKKRLHQMTRVGTTTGASRFENTTFGLVWIGIPAKSMLLDSKANRQLANECKNADQDKPLVATVAVPAAQS